MDSSMFTKAVLDPPFFGDNEDEIKYWKNLALQLLYKNKEYETIINGLPQESKKRPESPTTSPDCKPHSVDPFDFNNICEDTQSYVWQHYRGKDLLTMSEVSKSWNKRVEHGVYGETILNLSQKKLNVDDIEILTRKSYKAVSMEVGTLSSLPVSLCTDTVEKLKIINDFHKERLTFTKLKSLELNFNLGFNSVHFDWVGMIHWQMDELEDLKITSNEDARRPDYGLDEFYYGEAEFCDTVCLNFIYNLKNLKRLDFDRSTSHIIMEFLKINRLQLEDFRFVETEDFECLQMKLCKTLKKLTVSNPWTLNYIYDDDLTELTTLEFEDFEIEEAYDYLKGDELPVSNTIKNLSIKLKYVEYINFEYFVTNVVNILNTLPELESFFITKLTSTVMRFIAGNNLKIKTVKYNEIDDGTLEEYKEMRQTQKPRNSIHP